MKFGTGRAAIIVLDGLGAGPAPDTADYGDAGSDTLGNVARTVGRGGLQLPSLEKLGLGRCHEGSGILGFAEEPLVSSDFKQNSNSSIVDAEYTKVIGGHMIKILSWYDNEWGYSCRVRDLIKYIAGKGL